MKNIINRILVFSVLSSLGVHGNEANKRLYEDITRRANDYKLRPGGNGSRRMTLHLGLRLSQILDVDEKNQIITTNVWLIHEWIDASLTWDPEMYSGIDRIYIPSENIWLPDVVLYNNADGNYEVTLMTKATLFNTGRVRWEPPVIYKSFCPIDVEFYPFDVQNCSFKFGSWTYDGYQIDLKPLYQHQLFHQHPRPRKEVNDEESDTYNEAIDLREFYPSVEWDLLGVPAKWNEKYYPCCSAPYLDITFNITLRRKTLFHIVNLIIPCVAITFLTVLVFYLPSESGEKISLSVSILLSSTIFFLLLAEIIPPTSIVTPLIVKYLLFTMILVTMSIFGTVSILNIHFRSASTHIMSPWVRRIFLNILPHFLGLMKPQFSAEIKKKSNGKNNSDKKHSAMECERRDSIESHELIEPKSILKKNKSSSPCKYQTTTNPHLQWKIPRPKIIEASTSRNKSLKKLGQTVGHVSISTTKMRVQGFPPSTAPRRKVLNVFDSRADNEMVDLELCANLRKFRRGVECICEHVQKEDQEMMIKEEWKFLARVLDRLLLILFTSACLHGTICIIFQAPAMYDDSVAMGTSRQ